MEIKRSIGMKWLCLAEIFMSSFYFKTVVSCLNFQVRRYFFSFVWSHLLSFVLPLLRKNINCVFLNCSLNKIFVLLEILFQYLETVIIRGVFRTLLNMVELFAKIGTMDFSSMIDVWHGTEFTSDHDTVTYSN